MTQWTGTWGNGRTGRNAVSRVRTGRSNGRGRVWSRCMEERIARGVNTRISRAIWGSVRVRIDPLYNTHTHTPTLSHTHTLTHTPSHTPSHTHPHTPTLTHPPSHTHPLSHPHTHTLTSSHTHPHTLTHPSSHTPSHTHPHTPSHTPHFHTF